ncbi:isoleucine--tRNA ligase, mitochondrial [Drosophila grimshawi]|uniref:isoleucine--tRNA ligase n=1 Tax=Drosophila grimshawi TaxID=7222 RepID=B4IX85_DROGR|nr:isoleucine--tRNA ligase, mitochondrial [Drosophila grimshawi]EDV97417.1 GH16853 [Drosophila grimshawi]
MLRVIQFRLGVRLYSVKTVKKDATKYTDTINLPRTRFPNRLTAAKREEQERQILKHKISAAYEYQAQHKCKPTFVLHDGPPYANGQLHMGHAVNKILKDITLRQRVVQGQQVNYIPGWDCHGLPIELKATADAAAGEQNALDIRQKSRAFALEAIELQKEEFRSWGILANWQPEHIYLTFQPEFIANQLHLFYNLYERGLVYRDLKPVYWSPSSKTALAEAELEYDANFVSPSVYLRFALSGLKASGATQGKEIYALVWTTTPWTLPSNQAICYNSSLDYVLIRLSDRNPNELYLMASALVDDFQASTEILCEIVERLAGSALADCTYQHPVDKAQTALPFFAAGHVQDSKGTGLVHTAPAHGPDDFLISLAKKLPIKCYVNEAGIYTEEAPGFLRNKSVLVEGNPLVLQHIATDVVYASQFEHSYPIDWRTKQPVIIRASEQWFIDTDKLKAPAAAALERVEIYPRVNAESSKKALLTQLHKRPYWCISRQRAWGVPIPVLYRRDNKQVVLNAALIQHLCELLSNERSMDFWWSKPLEELLPDELLKQLGCKADELIKGSDIFDIWFDSGSTWSAVLKKQPNQMADMYLEGYDQFTGWFQSSLLTSIAARNCAPYKALFVHGFTVDEKGHKMSKSVGNVISPKQITKKYGTDVLRWWVASHGTQHMSITVSDKLLQQAADNLSKVRGTLRYLNGVINQKEQQQDLSIPTGSNSYLNQYILHSLLGFEEEIEKLYNAYEYNRVVATIQNFIANQISGIYVHLIKDRLYCGDDQQLQSIRHTLRHCYLLLCKALWPIAPYLIEESWSYYEPSGSAFHEQSVHASEDWRDAKVSRIVNAALDIKRLVNQQSGDVNSWHLSVSIKCCSQRQLELLCALNGQLNVSTTSSELCEILQVGSVILQPDVDAAAESATIDLQTLKVPLCPRCRRYSLVKAQQEICMRCSSILSARK